MGRRLAEGTEVRVAQRTAALDPGTHKHMPHTELQREVLLFLLKLLIESNLTQETDIPFSLACGWPSPCSQDVLTLSSHCPPFVCISMSIPPFHKDISHIGLDLPQ